MTQARDTQARFVPHAAGQIPCGVWQLDRHEIEHLENTLCRRSRVGGNPVKSKTWIPAFAGMTGFSWCSAGVACIP
jgi:hypothetical protein